MMEEMKELKLLRPTIRMTETMYNEIDRWEGKNFSDKAEKIFDFCFHERDRLYDEIMQLRKQKEELLMDCKRLMCFKEKIEIVDLIFRALEEENTDYVDRI